MDGTGTIGTLAGSGACGCAGDGGPAALAALGYPAAVAADGAGSVAVADHANHRVRRVGADGVITTVAGDGRRGDGGDGGPAVLARLGLPAAVAYDGRGNLFIADEMNHRVRRVDPAGVITTVAGGGGGTRLSSPCAVAVDDSGALYVAEAAARRVRRIGADGAAATVLRAAGAEGDTEGAVVDGAFTPAGLAVADGGALLVADPGGGRVLRVEPGAEPAVLPGTEGLAWAAPCAVAVDAGGAVFVADLNGHRVWRVAGGTAQVVAGRGEEGGTGDGGPAADAALAFPCGVAVDPAGRLLIADNLNHRVRVVALAGEAGTAGEAVEGAAGKAPAEAPAGPGGPEPDRPSAPEPAPAPGLPAGSDSVEPAPAAPVADEPASGGPVPGGPAPAEPVLAGPELVESAPAAPVADGPASGGPAPAGPEPVEPPPADPVPAGPTSAEPAPAAPAPWPGLSVFQQGAVEVLPGRGGQIIHVVVACDGVWDPGRVTHRFTAPSGLVFEGYAACAYYRIDQSVAGSGAPETVLRDGGAALEVTDAPRLDTAGQGAAALLVYSLAVGARADAAPGRRTDGRAVIAGHPGVRLKATVLSPDEE